MTPPRRWFAWWLFAESTARRLSRPPADIAASDVEVERLLAGSALFAMARAIAVKLGPAWAGSRTSRVLRPFAQDVLPLSKTDRLRVAGLVAVVAALTALALRVSDPMRIPWLELVVPGAVAVAGVIVAAFAGPLGRALADS